MKKYILEATDENILNSIVHDQLGRSPDVKDFLELIDSIDYNTFISVDAAWGEGKTFFIRQIEMTMKYYNLNSPSSYNEDGVGLSMPKALKISL